MTAAGTQPADESSLPLWFFIALGLCLPFTVVAVLRLVRRRQSGRPLLEPLDADVPPLPWPVWVGPALFVLLQMTMFFTIAAYATAAREGLVPSEPPGGIAMFSPGIFLGQIAPIVLGLSVLAFGGPRALASVGVRPERLMAGVGYGVFAFLAVTPVCCLALLANAGFNSLFHLPIQMHPLGASLLQRREVWVLLLAIFQAGVLAAVSEEFMFRGVLLQSLVQRFGRAAAVVLVSVVFALFHLPHEPQAILPLTILGLVLAYLALRTRSLVAPVVTHGLFNTFMLLTMFWG